VALAPFLWPTVYIDKMSMVTSNVMMRPEKRQYFTKWWRGVCKKCLIKRWAQDVLSTDRRWSLDELETFITDTENSGNVNRCRRVA